MLTGYCEEIVFRGILPHILKPILFHNSALACVSQAGLFALGHTSPKICKDENKTVGSIQFLNGLWAGVLYLLVGGDIVPCVISHAVSYLVFYYYISAFIYLLTTKRVQSFTTCRYSSSPGWLQMIRLNTAVRKAWNLYHRTALKRSKRFSVNWEQTYQILNLK